MKKNSKQIKNESQDQARKNRNFPHHTLEEALVLPQKIQDEMGGMPMNRLLLAQAISVSPSSSGFRDLLSSSYKYGLTEGTEKADQITLTEIGNEATRHADQNKRLQALRTAAVRPPVFDTFIRGYSNKKLPSTEMLPKILTTQYGVPGNLVSECSRIISANGKFVDLIRDIGGSPHILLDQMPRIATTDENQKDQASNVEEPSNDSTAEEMDSQAPLTVTSGPAKHVGNGHANGARPIFVGHGKNKGPLQQLQQLLTTFQIPHKVVVDEANLGRPISQKVKDTIHECGSAILIFTRDECFFDVDKKEIWRPSENVVHELGATSFAYGDRIVIFKEKGLHFPTNFQNIGYIEFENDNIQARTADLLKELIGFGLVRVTPT